MSLVYRITKHTDNATESNKTLIATVTNQNQAVQTLKDIVSIDCSNYFIHHSELDKRFTYRPLDFIRGRFFLSTIANQKQNEKYRQTQFKSLADQYQTIINELENYEYPNLSLDNPECHYRVRLGDDWYTYTVHLEDNPVLDETITSIEVSIRAIVSLKRDYDIKTIRDLIQLNILDLKKTNGVGDKSIGTIQAYLASHDLTFSPTFPHLEDINPHYPDVLIKKLLRNANLQPYADIIKQQAQSCELEFILFQLANSKEFEVLIEYNKYGRTLLSVYYQLLGQTFFELRSTYFHNDARKILDKVSDKLAIYYQKNI